MKTITPKIIMIDGDLAYHETYRCYFETYNDYSLMGIYSTVSEALSDYKNILPDIIVSDVKLPDMCGIEGIKLFRKKDPNVNVIMMSAFIDLEVIKKAFKYRANGYLTKPVNKDSLYQALNSIKHEGATMSSDVVKKVISMFQRKYYDEFSERENEIIEYLFEGATYKTIADKLFVTPSTVNFHIQNIYLKLNVNSKSEAFAKLREMDTRYKDAV